MPGLGLLVHLSLIWDWLSGRLGDLCSCIMIVFVDKSNKSHLLLALYLRPVIYSRPNSLWIASAASEHRANAG